MEYPLLVEEYSLIPDSGGAGCHRGGLGIRRTIRVQGHETTFLGTLERQRFPAWGLFGGRCGAKSALIRNAGTSSEQFLGSRVAGLRLRDGETVTIITAGGGGYGPPEKRDPARVVQDLREQKVSPRCAVLISWQVLAVNSCVDLDKLGVKTSANSQKWTLASRAQLPGLS